MGMTSYEMLSLTLSASGPKAAMSKWPVRKRSFPTSNQGLTFNNFRDTKKINRLSSGCVGAAKDSRRSLQRPPTLAGAVVFFRIDTV